MAGLGLGSGYTTVWLAHAGATDRFRWMRVFVVCDVRIATTIAVIVFGQVEFAVFATAYILTQMFLLLGAVMIFRLAAPASGPMRMRPPRVTRWRYNPLFQLVTSRSERPCRWEGGRPGARRRPELNILSPRPLEYSPCIDC
jgi:hypothetical protein